MSSCLFQCKIATPANSSGLRVRAPHFGHWTKYRLSSFPGTSDACFCTHSVGSAPQSHTRNGSSLMINPLYGMAMFRDIRTAAGLETRPVCPTCSRGKPRRHAFAGDQRVAPEPFFRRRRPARLQKSWSCGPDLKLCLLPPDALDHFPDFKAVGPLARHPPDVVRFPAYRALCGAAVQTGPGVQPGAKPLHVRIVERDLCGVVQCCLTHPAFPPVRS